MAVSLRDDLASHNHLMRNKRENEFITMQIRTLVCLMFLKLKLFFNPDDDKTFINSKINSVVGEPENKLSG